MRAKMLRVIAPPDAIDVVGTGGDASGSFNISTCAAFVVAGAGVPVAKHGNRALSSHSGAADVLAALGVKIDLPPDDISRCIREAGIGFMFAPAHHPAMKTCRPDPGRARHPHHLQPARPAVQPGRRQAPDGRRVLQAMDRAARPGAEELGSERAWVVHGSDGLDEITTSGPTAVAALENGEVRTFEIAPEDVGLQRAKPEALSGGDADHNAEALRAVLKGERGAVPRRRGAQCRRRAGGRRQGEGSQGRRRAGAEVDRRAARPRAALDRLIAVSNA